MIKNLYCVLVIGFFIIETLFPFSNCEFNEENHEELCIQEIFKPNCPQGDVVFVREAKYGRMKIGKCLSEKELEMFGAFNKDPRYLGCFDEVSQMITDKCSFKSDCKMKVSDLLSDSKLLESTVCLPGLIKYLEVQYSCLSVFSLNEIDNCKVVLPRKTTHLNPKYVPNHCKSNDGSLIVEVPKGQRIRFSILNLNKRVDTQTNNWQTDRTSCGLALATIKDGIIKSNATVCHNGFLITDFKSEVQNFKPLYLTKNHFAEITLLSINERINNYLLRLEVEGCLDIIPPEDAWLKRTKDDIVVGCYSSKQTWYLRCEQGKWSGTIGNCSHLSQKFVSVMDNDVELLETGKIKMSDGSQIFVIVAICGFGLIICLMIVCCGMIYLNRMKRKNIPISEDKMQGTMQYSSYCTNGIPFNTTNRIQPPLINIDESIDHERYQVLDREEVAKESSLLSDI